jgi:hypothetical protein
MQAEHQLGDGINRGKREMRELAVAAFSALEQADLTDILELLHTRVFGRPPAELMNVELVDGIWVWKFKPMVELMLRHINDTAGDRGQPIDARRDDLRTVLELLGF